MPKVPFMPVVPGIAVSQAGGSSGTLAWREQALAGTPLFGGLSRRDIRAVARVTTMSRLSAGEAIVTEGKTGSLFGIVVEGTVRVVRKGRTVARLGPGAIFGEVAVLDPGPRTASLIAQTDVECLELQGANLLRVLSQEPGVAVKLAQELARRLRAALVSPLD